MQEDDDHHLIDHLLSLISSSKGASYVEARYQSRFVTEINFVNGNLDKIRAVENAGCGIRVLVDGCWGFSSTNNISTGDLRESLGRAVSAAHSLAQNKKNKIKGLADAKIARGTFRAVVNGSLSDIDIEQKVKVVKEAEKAARKYSSMIKTASCIYREILDHKSIVNSDGAEVEIFDSKPEFSVSAIARKGSQSATAHEGIGITGGWRDLFKKGHIEYATAASGRAVKL